MTFTCLTHLSTHVSSYAPVDARTCRERFTSISSVQINHNTQKSLTFLRTAIAIVSYRIRRHFLRGSFHHWINGNVYPKQHGGTNLFHQAPTFPPSACQVGHVGHEPATTAFISDWQSAACAYKSVCCRSDTIGLHICFFPQTGITNSSYILQGVRNKINETTCRFYLKPLLAGRSASFHVNQGCLKKNTMYYINQIWDLYTKRQNGDQIKCHVPVPLLHR